MVIKSVAIRAFKSIFDLTLEVNPKINVFIGANESGKTNFLKAIEAFRPDIPYDSSLTCQYSNNYYMGKCPEITLEFSGLTKENRHKLVHISDVFKDVESFQIRRDAPEISDYHLIIGDQEIENVNMVQLLKALPKIIYFSNIPLLKNKVDYDSLISNSSAFLTEKNLLKIGGIEDYELLFEDSTRGRRACEEASRIITEQIRRVWTQEDSIEIKLNVNGRVLYIDFADATTVLDTPESRSLGFRWYLSFYVNFISQTFEGRSNEYIFLIDEPGIHLHPAGQKDLIKVIEDLSLKNQIFYTTHSPFLIDRAYPERVFLVSKDKTGTKIDSRSYRENWRPLRKQIGLTVSDLFFFSEDSLILEVPTKKKWNIFKRFRVDGGE
ncbi:MAG: AAA family ATPase [candidate division KSB1 bacterium]|nr:AAA family ATPase [candidate division KSB1 bacterium]MDZ7346655.1 AAA family ATPase [candidate division KSB1 bacterium]